MPQLTSNAVAQCGPIPIEADWGLGSFYEGASGASGVYVKHDHCERSERYLVWRLAGRCGAQHPARMGRQRRRLCRGERRFPRKRALTIVIYLVICVLDKAFMFVH